MGGGTVNWLDLSLLIAVAAFIGIGFAKGFARTAIGFAAFVIAVAAAFWFYGPLGFWLRSYIDSKPLASATAFTIVFLAIVMLGHVAEWFSVKFVKAAHLSWVDRSMGAAFGMVQGLLVAAVVVLMYMTFAPKPLPKVVAESRYVPYLEDAAHVLAAAAPYEVKEGYQRARRDLEGVAPPPVKKQLKKLDAAPI